MKRSADGYFWPATLEEMLEATETHGSYGAIKLSSELMAHLVRRILNLEHEVGSRAERPTP